MLLERPDAVVANDSDDGDAMAREGVELTRKLLKDFVPNYVSA